MNILFLTSRLPYPPDRGDRVRVFNFLRHISSEHEVTLFSFIADPQELKHINRLEPYCQKISVVLMLPWRSKLSVLLNFWRPEPLQALYYRNSDMSRLVDQYLESKRFDIIYIHLFRMASYFTKYTRLYRIVDLTDVISNEVKLSLPYRRFASRFLYSIEKPRIERYERWLANNFEETWLTSVADKAHLKRSCPNANLQLVTIGVDRSIYYPLQSVSNEYQLIYVGHLSVFHNVDAAIYLAKEILPLVQMQIPHCTLHIVGADPLPQLMDLAKKPNITVSGFVHDLNAELNKASIFVAPLRFAAGVQTKVLEAMSAGVPVVTTSIVNQGLGAEEGQEIILADDSKDMVSGIVTLLQNAKLRASIGKAGREFVIKKFRWENVLHRLNEIETEITTSAIH